MRTLLALANGQATAQHLLIRLLDVAQTTNGIKYEGECSYRDRCQRINPHLGITMIHKPFTL
jgi:hypothetical protein